MSGDARELLQAYLRQRAELGETEVVLDGLGAAELRALYARAPQAPAAPPARPAVGEPAMRPSPDAPAVGAAAEELLRLPTLDALREVALGCPRCRLAETRGHVVFGEGSPDADVLVVGEAPGAEEDRTGRPFVGRAGQLLTVLLASVGLSREEVYVCNVLKCRPPGNRNPQADEVEACSPYLLRQVELVKPRVVAAFGAFAAQTLLGTTTPVGKLRGRVHDFRGVPLVATYHPAALLRSSAWVRPTWEDLQRLRAVLDRV
ncbi:MAG TPA: uracil-DNA glycosylase [Longimicrobiaceae bacterium]|nr:uracil-DNA glycosylase [Longimicrobiaceae bacterium]